jgi:hypothetical protein
VWAMTYLCPQSNSATLASRMATAVDDSCVHDGVWCGVCAAQAYHQPESLVELEALVKAAHNAGTRLRPIGSALSPNGASPRAHCCHRLCAASVSLFSLTAERQGSCRRWVQTANHNAFAR